MKLNPLSMLMAAMFWPMRMHFIENDAPDLSGQNRAAEANAAIAGRQQDLAEQQWKVAQDRQAQFDPLFRQIIDQSLTSAKTNDERSAQQWQSYLDNFAPAEKKLSDTALNYDTAGRRDEAGAEARAGVAQEAAMQQQAQQRSLGRAGVSLSSGRALTLDNAQRFNVARASAGADRQARNLVEATGMSLVDNVAKTGRGLASTGLEAARLALGAGQGASGTLGSQQQTYNASLAPSAGLFNSAVNSNNGAANIYGNIADIQQRSSAADAAGLGGLGSLIGTLGSAGKGSVFGSLLLSSRKAKDEVGDVDTAAALDSVVRTPVKAWKYKGDDEVRLGPYAEQVHESTGLGKSHRLDIATELGTLRAAVQEIVSRGGLADAKPGKGLSSAKPATGTRDLSSQGPREGRRAGFQGAGFHRGFQSGQGNRETDV